MSQYPSPYSPPNVQAYYGMPSNPLRPARRASVMMWIVGGLMFLVSGCLIGMSFSFSVLPPDSLAQIREKLANPMNMPAEQLLRFMGAFLAVLGVVLISLAFFVRRGGMVSTVASCVLVGLMVLRQLYLLVASMAYVASNPAAIGDVCGSGIVLSVMTLLFVWLVLAAIAVPKIRRAQQQYAAQYWQYQQNWQGYSGNGPASGSLGYAERQAPPPPVQNDGNNAN